MKKLFNILRSEPEWIFLILMFGFMILGIVASYIDSKKPTVMYIERSDLNKLLQHAVEEDTIHIEIVRE